MKDFYRQIACLYTYDAGGRGLAGAVRQPALEELAEELEHASRVMILTGFPIPAAGCGETDGPGGAANAARACTLLGKRVCVVTDAPSLPLVQAACALYAPEARVVCVPMDRAEEVCAQLLAEEQPTHMLALERPGKCRGHYHNMGGKEIDAFVADTDTLFRMFDGVKIGVGDGGNELGMGNHREMIMRNIPGGREICADTVCDYPLVAGVSNWWGWGIAALLELRTGRDLLPSDAQEEALLRAVVEAGGVDGITQRPELTVDGLSLDTNLHILRGLRRIVAEAARCGSPTRG